MKVRVVSKHVSNYPRPIGFDRGDRLKLGRRDTEYEGWVRVTTSDGNEGWAPEQFLEVEPDGHAVANCAYTAKELTVAVGDYLTVQSETNGWYWVKAESGEAGWVPKEAIANVQATGQSK